MKFTKTILTAAVFSFGLAGATQADDYKFDGIYGGLELGGNFTKLNGDKKRDRNFYYGGLLGYRTQSDEGIVLGLEATLGDTGYDNKALRRRSTYEWSTSVTFGSVFGAEEDNLIYGKIGYVQGRFRDYGKTPRSFNDKGWRAGAGYERSITDNISLRLSADYTRFGKNANSWTANTGIIFKF